MSDDIAWEDRDEIERLKAEVEALRSEVEAYESARETWAVVMRSWINRATAAEAEAASLRQELDGVLKMIGEAP